jgi:hypothetical protein
MRVVGAGSTRLGLLIAMFAFSPAACGGRTLGFDDYGAGGFDFGVGGSPGVSGNGSGAGGSWSSGGLSPTKGGAPTMASGGRPVGPTTGGVAAGGFPTSGGRASGGAPSSGGRFATGGTSNGGTPDAGGVAGAAGGDAAGAGGEGPDCAVTGNCTCAANDSFVVYVDPVYGNDVDLGTVHPTGVKYPAACRFATLGKGLSKAPSGASVIAFSESASFFSPLIFRQETFPLVVPSGVTLRGPTPGARGEFRIAYGGSSTAILLQDQAALEDLIVETAGGSGSLVTCKDNTKVSLSSVTLVGDSGITSTALLGCTATVADIDVSGGTFCLDTRASVGTSAVTVNRGYFSNCSVGIEASGTFVANDITVDTNGEGMFVENGSADLSFAYIASNRPDPGRLQGVGRGVVVNGGSLQLSDSQIQNNYSAGLHVAGGTVDLISSTILENGFVDFTRPAEEAGSGVYIEGAAAVRINGGTISFNGMHGIHLGPGSNIEKLTLDSTVVDHNLYVGLQIDGTVSSSFQARSTQFSDNGSGGLIFNQGVPFEAFVANRIFSNGGSQLTFMQSALGGAWKLGAPDPGCGLPNEISCYAGSPPGIFAAPGATVDAGYVRWQYADPTAGRDFTGPVSADHACSAGDQCLFVNERERP